MTVPDHSGRHRILAIFRGLVDAALLLGLLYWMLFLGLFGLWNFSATPGWCSVYFGGLALHLLLFRKSTRTRASFTAWLLAGLLTVPLILELDQAGWPFKVDRIGGWNQVLDTGEVSFVLWPFLHLALWWILRRAAQLFR